MAEVDALSTCVKGTALVKIRGALPAVPARMKSKINPLIVVSSILLCASVSKPVTIRAGQIPRTLVHGLRGVHSVRNPAASASYHSDGKIVEFDAPGASKVATTACVDDGCGTFPTDINGAGTIVGTSVDKYLVPHGFIRGRDGRSLSFDAPGAGLGHDLYEGTYVYAIDAAGAIVGEYEDAQTVNHGFVREPNGSFSRFNVPGAGTGPNQGTFADNINGYGDTAGFYLDSNNVEHGFVRTRDGHITTFDGPGSIHTHVCYVDCLSAAGVTGVYNTKDGIGHGFLREPNGKLILFDAPGAGKSGALRGTFPFGINAQGTITGFFADSNLNLHGFIRYRNGEFLTGQVPGSGKSSYQGTWPYTINALDAVTGYFIDSNNVYHGFERFPNGALAKFEAPDADTASYDGTFPNANNVRGEVVGSYIDKNGLFDGFLWTP